MDNENDFEKFIVTKQEFETVKINENGTLERFVGKIALIEKDCYLITIPKNKSHEFEAQKRENINLYIVVPEGILTLKCRVFDCLDKYYKISLPLSMVQTPRNEFLRVNMEIPIKIMLKVENKLKIFDTTTNSICARGANFNFDFELFGYEKIKAMLKFKNALVETDVSVIKSEYKVAKNGAKYDIDINFKTISKENVNFIVKECFMHQLKIKKQFSRVNYVEYGVKN